MNTAVPVVRCMLHGSGAVLHCKSDHQGMSSRANVPLRTGGWRLANHARASKQPARALTTVRCTRDLAPAGPLPRDPGRLPRRRLSSAAVRLAGRQPAAMCRRALPLEMAFVAHESAQSRGLAASAACACACAAVRAPSGISRYARFGKARLRAGPVGSRKIPSWR